MFCAGETQMPTVKAKGTKGFRAAAGDEAVIFSIRTGVRDEHFAFSVDAVPEIIARMIAAHADAAQKEGRLPHAIVAQASVVAIDENTGAVTLSLMPTEKLHIPFSLSPSLAQKTADSLAKAVSSRPPPADQQRH
jgi:hypothetical protein